MPGTAAREAPSRANTKHDKPPSAPTFHRKHDKPPSAPTFRRDTAGTLWQLPWTAPAVLAAGTRPM